MTYAQKLLWVVAHGDRGLHQSLISDQRPRSDKSETSTEEDREKNQGFSKFYLKNKIRYIDNTDSDYNPKSDSEIWREKLLEEWELEKKALGIKSIKVNDTQDISTTFDASYI